MAQNTLISFQNLAKVLEEYGAAVRDAYRLELDHQDKIASGNLSTTVRYIVVKGTKTYAVDLSLADYWEYVEDGRPPGGFPPPDKILKWIEIRPIIPRPFNGRLPTIKQLAYLIGRKIAREGVEPTPVLEAASTTVYDEFLERIGAAITADLEEAVDGVLAGLGR